MQNINLFINAVTQNWTLILFDNNKKILSQKNIEILWNESSRLVEIIDIFLKKENNIKYSDLENLIVVNWPWSFTGVRTIVLAINSINFIINKNITSLSFFDLFENYPIIKSSSRRDLFVKYKKSDKIQIVKNDDFIEKMSTEGFSPLMWDLSNNILSEEIKVNSEINYKKVLEKIIFQENKLIEPLYIKKPNIS
jgi:tRNA A37 threonylcarbamoyladenosine modification protein TsaB